MAESIVLKKISPEERERIDEIKKMCRVKTDAGALRILIKRGKL